MAIYEFVQQMLEERPWSQWQRHGGWWELTPEIPPEYGRSRQVGTTVTGLSVQYEARVRTSHDGPEYSWGRILDTGTGTAKRSIGYFESQRADVKRNNLGLKFKHGELMSHSVTIEIHDEPEQLPSDAPRELTDEERGELEEYTPVYDSELNPYKWWETGWELQSKFTKKHTYTLDFDPQTGEVNRLSLRTGSRSSPLARTVHFDPKDKRPDGSTLFNTHYGLDATARELENLNTAITSQSNGN